jgi:hypothetical protein
VADDATCKACGRIFRNRSGMLIHFGRKHRNGSTVVISDEGGKVLELVAHLIGDAAAERLRVFLAELPVWPADGFVVLNEDDGPYLTRSSGVGTVVAGTRAGCIVFPLKVAADAVARDRWRSVAEENRTSRRKEAV